MVTYLMKPSDIRSLSKDDAIRLGLMRDYKYEDAKLEAKNLFGEYGKLICTIERSIPVKSQLMIISDGKSTPYEMEMSDSCYPIINEDWDQFLIDEKKPGIVSKPLEIWAVDGNKYTAPI